jgi:hypothetical protein
MFKIRWILCAIDADAFHKSQSFTLVFFPMDSHELNMILFFQKLGAER